MDDLKQLEQKKQALEKEIQETRDRLPAHSAKPPIMTALFDLEDEYEAVVRKINQLKTG